MRNLYLLRHGTPDFKDGIKLCIGRTDIDIGQKGELEAINLREFFKDKDIEYIYSSPLKRCIRSAEIIADGNFDIIINEDLAEIYMGSWEGLVLKDIKKELGDEPLDGEKRIDALARMEGAIQKIMNSSTGDVICVAHAGVNCAFIAKILGEDIKISRGLKQACGCYNHLEYDGGKFKLISSGVLPKEVSKI